MYLYIYVYGSFKKVHGRFDISRILVACAINSKYLGTFYRKGLIYPCKGKVCYNELQLPDGNNTGLIT